MNDKQFRNLIDRVTNAIRDIENEAKAAGHDIYLQISTGVNDAGMSYIRIEDDEPQIEESDRAAVSQAIEGRRKKDDQRSAPNATLPKIIDPGTSTI